MTKIYNAEVIPVPTNMNKVLTSSKMIMKGKITYDNKKDKMKSKIQSKKMGGGKKGMWGKPEELIPIQMADEGDPNYDSEGEENVILVPNTLDDENICFSDNDNNKSNVPNISVKEFKNNVDKIISEYYINGDIDDVIQSISEMDCPSFHFEIVKRSISLSLDKHEKEREMTSKLLSALYPNILSSYDIGKGFRRLFEHADDLQLDIPNARTLLSTFLGRAVVDEIVPPSFLMNPLIIKLGNDIVENAKKKLSIHHGAARLERGWGPGDGRPVEELKIAIDQLIQEYILSGDMTEASRCVQELHVPEFHHEVVKRFLKNGFESGDDACQSILSLLKYLLQDGVISECQISKGFDKIKAILSDITLDVPNSPKMFEKCVSTGIMSGILDESYSI